MSALMPEQVAEVRAIVAEMIGQILKGANERLSDRLCAAQEAADVAAGDSLRDILQ